MNLDDAYPRKMRPERKKSSAILTATVLILWALILAALVVPNLLGHSGSRVATPMSDISTLSSAVDAFKLDCGRYPTTKEGLQALRVPPSQVHGWRGPYLRREVPLDPWGNPYHYLCPGPGGGGYEVESYGADGRPGGTGDNADIGGGSDT